jgi:hypothetical protein
LSSSSIENPFIAVASIVPSLLMGLAVGCGDEPGG